MQAFDNNFGSRTEVETALAGIDLSGKIIVMTGCNAGIGLESLRSLLTHGATVLTVCRSVAKAEAAIAECKASPAKLTIPLPHVKFGTGIPFACELSDFDSVVAVADALKKHTEGKAIFAMLLNAGVSFATLKLKYGVELSYVTNHLGHLILIEQMRQKLIESAQMLGPDALVRIVVLASKGHRWVEKLDLSNVDGSQGYKMLPFYSQSKLMNILCVKHLAKDFAAHNVAIVSVHPGVIATSLFSDSIESSWFMRWLATQTWFFTMLCWFGVFKTVQGGAAVSTFVAATSDLRIGHSGAYFDNFKTGLEYPCARDMTAAAKLSEWSIGIVKKWLPILE